MSKSVDCRICKLNKANGGIDCDPYPEDYFLPCEAFDPIEKPLKMVKYPKNAVDMMGMLKEKD